MNSLEEIFQELGISQYLGAFVDQGFDTWETILDITESDLDALGVKLGHRRKLQRRIANYRGVAPAASLVSPARTSIEESSAANTNKPLQPEVKDAGSVSSTKRKYRRHPKPDENAPERPPSAYVLFSNKMREDLKGQNLTFTEIAKLVGENWQSLDRSEKEPYETQALDLKERYNRDMNEYKQTVHYKRYSEYLQEFRRRQALHDKDASKKARLDTDGRTRGGGIGNLSLGPSAANSNTGSGSESQPGSEPPPTRQQRLDSITSQPESHKSPVVATHVFPRPADEMCYSPMSSTQDEHGPSRARGFSSPIGRDVSELPSLNHPVIREGHRSDSSSAYLPPIAGAGEPRVLAAPISHSPENGMPSIAPVLNHRNTSRHGSGSSSYWSRTPSLLTEQSSTGSTTSLGSVGPPRTPSESSLPIHALLSSKPEAPSPTTNTKPLPDGMTVSQPPPAIHRPQSSRPPGHQVALDSKPVFSDGRYPTITTTQLPPVAPLTTSLGAAPAAGSPAMGPAEPSYDGMSALLRASDIVGRQRQ
ncbi:hypothetical protein JX266_008083 [Neoarthrinium moseri]|nr:hypothetical protein JX266_008083 [Neoarthrinium moseri]